MLNRIRYFPFGSVRTQELAGGAGSLLTDKLFTGQQRESANGVYDYQARLYDARMGRFLQPDPLVPEPGNPQSLNRYSYVLNNPLRYTDPTGMYPVGPDGERLDIPPEPPEPPGPPGPIRCPCIIQAPPHWKPNPPAIRGTTLGFPGVIPVVRPWPGVGVGPAGWILGGIAAWETGQILGHAIGLDTLRSDDSLEDLAKRETLKKVPENFWDPTQPPAGEGWEWRPTGSEVGSSQGSWYNPKTGESVHPDLEHPQPIGPHYDYKDRQGNNWRIFPDGRVTPK
jgi:RHS repeat-associated protein